MQSIVSFSTHSNLMKIQISKYFPSKKYLIQAKTLINPFMSNLPSKIHICIDDIIEKQFFEIILKVLESDTNFKQAYLLYQQNISESKLFIMSYLMQCLDKYLQNQLNKELVQLAPQISFSVSIGDQRAYFYNQFVFCYENDKDKLFYLDLGVSLFLIEFYSKFFEFEEIISRVHKNNPNIFIKHANTLTKEALVITQAEQNQQQMLNLKNNAQFYLNKNQLNFSDNQHTFTTDTPELLDENQNLQVALQQNQNTLQQKVQQLEQKEQQYLQIIQLLQKQVKFLMDENDKLKNFNNHNNKLVTQEQQTKSDIDQIDFDMLRDQLRDSPLNQQQAYDSVVHFDQ